MRAPIRHALASAAAASLLLTACSSGSNDATSPTSATTEAPSGTTEPSGTSAGSTTPGSTATGGSAPSTSSAGSSATNGSNGSNGSSASGGAGNTASGSGSTGANRPTVVPNPTDNSRPTAIAGTPGTGCVPTRVDVPSVGISEPIVAMGTNSQGQIYPPPRTTMWYDKSPQPGANGVAVVAGHVTYDGPDDFYELDRVKNGASVTVRCSNGRVLSWKVSEKQSVLKTALQTDQRVWGGSSTPVVALITCDRASKVVNGHHLNNYVVWVRPA